jgi:hypothetical protein
VSSAVETHTSGAHWPGLVTTSKSGMKQARAIMHVRQTKSAINFRIICDLSFPKMTNTKTTPGLVLVLQSINSVLALPYSRSMVRGNLVATALSNTRNYTSAEQARGISPVTIRLCHQQRKCTPLLALPHAGRCTATFP